MGESKVLKSAKIPRQQRQELNIAQAIAERQSAIKFLAGKDGIKIGENSSNTANNISGADQKGKKKGLPAKNLMAKRHRKKKINDRLYILRFVVPKITKV
ncbi:hypothetical protein H5410_050467 [Solanum commersonii]|uniref:Uncharacterized protein n=1 Tax=Solanum commersonii TaxID=4109 RepID=A0A9J5WXY6_SOLCO|nr:hypothetical protein H5410_050467 [Solanum commersonii]